MPPKLKFFFWLGLHGRLWTAKRRRRHGLQQHDECALCDQEPERVDHLLCSCVFTREVWTRLLAPTGNQHLAPSPASTLADWWLAARLQMPADFKRAFDSLVITTAWTIWKERNRRTFNLTASPAQRPRWSQRFTAKSPASSQRGSAALRSSPNSLPESRRRSSHLF